MLLLKRPRRKGVAGMDRGIPDFRGPLAPLAWAVITAPWQVGIINIFSGFLWAGYNLSSFNLLLELTPDDQRPRAVALFQTAVFGSAVIGPILGGFLADALGFRYIFGFSAAGRILGMILFILFTIRPRQLSRVWGWASMGPWSHKRLTCFR